MTAFAACHVRGGRNVVQYNGYGHVNTNIFYAESFCMLYRSCNNIKYTVEFNHVKSCERERQQRRHAHLYQRRSRTHQQNPNTVRRPRTTYIVVNDRDGSS
ncbi:hypothetical protein PPTG_07259 [Phytophthora nicotianae INRA-310]|uniref:pectate lyase n=1 Tax=Phytophthora nicotianae (strain INRA-310) TaxID=761204 RepID=W2QPC3_PHYN3|nr:hypothetical protein PPTG_07259 [Phytophthora nicotianae INRA-310]ETN15047.1 hypothetical protein PPTG_07259 [Phytophthora nicotianae INRA-310]